MDVVRLVKRAKKGDKEALLQLVLARKDEYYRLARTYVNNSHDASDAMEEMIVKLYEKIDQLKKNESFYSWSKTILVNECRNIIRKQNKTVFIEEWVVGDEVIDPIKVRDQQLELHDLLLLVNDEQREAIQLKYLHDLDYQSIAKITDVSVGTVKSRVFQGLKKLKELHGGDRGE